MARPIEATPTLSGEDARAFLEDIANLKYSAEKERDLKEARAFYEYHVKRMPMVTKRILAFQKKERDKKAALKQK